MADHPGRRREFLIETLSLQHLLTRSVRNLSGGEKQRVALARALVVGPSVLLLDEPLSALDPNFREEIREALKRLHRETGITVLMVTHDFAETRFLAQKVAVINDGSIEQTGSLESVFHQPRTPLVAEFVGMKNVFPAVFQGTKAMLGDMEIDAGRPVGGEKQFLAVRPEDIRVRRAPMNHNGYRSLKGKVLRVSDNGFFCDVYIRTGTVVFQASATRGMIWDMQLRPGVEVWVNFRASSIHAF